MTQNRADILLDFEYPTFQGYAALSLDFAQFQPAH